MSNIKVDNIKFIVPNTQVDALQPKKTESEHKTRVKQVNLSQHEVSLLESGKTLFDGMEDIDAAKVEQIKAQIASGELVFDMDELARVIARLDHGK
ncbi:flagellar biosynthesis anti-sigma factor FlgM [Vibrio maritimus]|uniref:flagellar biosynthesis anti-sigma factor FlgM n=1 Tax=Vibrio maritimus TaxID=990268 RepID=UPI004068B1AF